MATFKRVILTFLVAIVAVKVGSYVLHPSQPAALPLDVPQRTSSLRPSDSPPWGARSEVVDGQQYWILEDVCYRSGDHGLEIVAEPLVHTLPDTYYVVLAHGIIHYVVDDVYYQRVPDGYIVVPKPVRRVATCGTPPPTPESPVSEALTIYVPKPVNEGFVPVTLKKVGNAYLGPQGELYLSIPPPRLLSELYGLSEMRWQDSSEFHIHVPHRDGKRFKHITLTRYNHGYLGPQGEFYPLMPSIAQLSAVYDTAGEQAHADDSISIHVPKQEGDGFVQINLKQYNRAYVGPQGRVYFTMPSIDQLQETYGRE